MLLTKKKYRPPFALSFRASRRLICSAKRAALAKKKIKSISLVDLPDIGVAGLSEVVVHASPVTDEVSPKVLSSVEEYRPVEEDEQDNPFILVKNRKSTIPRGWNYFGNYAEAASGRIVIVWDPSVLLVIYDATAQSVTCGVSILSENINLTVTFIYGFNLVEERRSMWNSLVDLQASSPVSSHPWADAQLYEAQAKGVPYTWRNSQDVSPISTRIDHAFINQPWSSLFPDWYAEFLDPCQSDHAPCLFRMPSVRRQVIKPFKFFYHVIDHPDYAGIVREAWNSDLITGTNQFKLVRSLKLLKRPLRSLNRRHFSGISDRVKEQKEKVDILQRALLTSPNSATAQEEHAERDKLNVLLKAEEKFYRQRSRVRWADVGDRNTPFYHRTVSTHATRNHIHYLKDADDRVLYSAEEIKSHAADYFQGILGTTDLPFSSVSPDILASGGFGSSFSSRVTWEAIRTPSPLVQWYSVVWFKEEIPRCSFISWTAFLGRLPTRDRLISWGLSVSPGCALCSLADESIEHFCSPLPAAPWTSCLPGSDCAQASQPKPFFRVVDRAMRDRLLSLSRPSSSAPHPSLLELYFWFLSPFS
ncbi:BnaA09g28790D [Brassica napus]|uniref:BnaA09g28790D protein n=1 Tax=Brassica napus TaxID=3708 RepID=A0A078FNX2_BRANA|nr:BnaA09g28790D [Brassica napus]